MEVEGRHSDVDSLVDNGSPGQSSSIQRSRQESDEEQLSNRSPSPDGVLSASDSESEVDIFPAGEDEDIENNDDTEEDIDDEDDTEDVYEEDRKSTHRKDSGEERQEDRNSDVDDDAEKYDDDKKINKEKEISAPISEDEAAVTDEREPPKEDTPKRKASDDDVNSDHSKPKNHQSEQKNKPSSPDNAKRGKKEGDTKSRPVKKKQPKKKASFKSGEAAESDNDLMVHNDSGNGDDQRENNAKPQAKGKKQNMEKSKSKVQANADRVKSSKKEDLRDPQNDEADQKKIRNQRQNSQKNQRKREPANDKSKSKSRENLRASDEGDRGKEEEVDNEDNVDSVSVDRSRPHSQVSPKRRSKSSSRKKTTPRKNQSRSNSSDEIFERLHRSDTISFSGSAIKDAPRAEDVISRKPYGTESELKEISDRLFTTPISHSKNYIKPRARDIISREDLEPEELDRVFERLHNTGTVSFSGHAPLNGPVAIDEISRDVTSGREVRQITQRLNSSHTLSTAGSDRCRTTPELPPIGYGKKGYPIIKGIETRFRGSRQLEYPKVVAAVDRLYTGHTTASKSRVDAPVSEKPALVLREYLAESQTWK